MLSEYHQHVVEENDESIRHQVTVKELQFNQVFASLGMPTFATSPIRIAVLGCKERRLALWQNELFAKLFAKPVQITTFDITTDQLTDVPNVVQHDATRPLPQGPFDMVYADVLLRFVPAEQQFAILKNAWDALAPGGMSMISFARDDYDPHPEYVPVPGTHRVDMNAIQLELAKHAIPFLEVPVEIETTVPGTEKDVTIDDLFLCFRKP